MSQEKENEYSKKQQFRDMFAKKRSFGTSGTETSTRASMVSSDQSLHGDRKNGVKDSDYTYTTEESSQQPIDSSTYRSSSVDPFAWTTGGEKKKKSAINDDGFNV